MKKRGREKGKRKKGKSKMRERIEAGTLHLFTNNRHIRRPQCYYRSTGDHLRTQCCAKAKKSRPAKTQPKMIKKGVEMTGEVFQATCATKVENDVPATISEAHDAASNNREVVRLRC